MARNKQTVSIKVTDVDGVLVTITTGKSVQRLLFGTHSDSYLTGADLSRVLDILDVANEYEYLECNCDKHSWRGEGHATACPVSDLELAATAKSKTRRSKKLPADAPETKNSFGAGRK